MAINGLGTASGSGFVTQATLDATVGLVPITPTSIANSGGSASASGAAVTFSGVSSISLNGVFTSTYDNYRVIISQTQSAVVAAYLRLRTSGTDVSASNYWYGNAIANASGAAISNNAGASQTQLDVYGGATGTGSHCIDVIAPNIAAPTRFTWSTMISTTAVIIGTAGGGQYTASTQVDGLSFYPFSGTVTGTIRVYGYRNS
jgi:uncharacterized protein (DUF849 family)